MHLSIPNFFKKSTALKVSQESHNKADETHSSRRIAIIGSGVSGLSVAYYMDKHFMGKRAVGKRAASNRASAAVSIFEADTKPGGHVHTVDVAGRTKTWLRRKQSTLNIDTGFIVCNDRTYPNFLRLLDDLGVAKQPSEMSFSVRNDTGLEYKGHNLNTMLAKRRYALSPSFWRFIKDILHFNKAVQKHAKADASHTIGTFLAQQNYGKLFADNYLLPMISAIWSMGLAEVKEFPLVFFIKFFSNHGLLSLTDRPQWYTICGGSRRYVTVLLERFSGELKLNTPVTKVLRHSDGVTVTYKHKGIECSQEFDDVVFACHADTALALLGDASSAEKDILGQFAFTKNTAVLHTDTRLLPKRKRAWASWNYRLPKADTKKKPILTYYMNRLQQLNCQKNYMVSLNQPINPEHTIKTIDYAHPVYNSNMMAAQTRWADISGKRHTHFCGAYWFNGFHEDGIKSGLRVCQALGAQVDVLDVKQSRLA